MNKEVELYHSFDAKLATNIGEQSVSSKLQAVIELIKNGYDADATECKVYFITTSQRGNNIGLEKIIVEDDGIGMSFEDLAEKWMRVATPNKERDTRSPIFKRRVSGEKGMGHFASQRLGHVVKIISKPKSYAGRPKTDYPNSVMELVIDWNKYEPGKDFQEIPNTLKITDKQDEGNHGVRIEITDLKDQWTIDDIDAVMVNAGTLLAPSFIRKGQKHPFDIRIIPVGFSPKREVVESAVEKYAPWEIRAKLAGSTIHFQFFRRESNDEARKPAPDVGTRGKGRGQRPAGDKTCGDAGLVFYAYEGRASTWAPRAVRKSTELDKQLDENCGIKIFNDGVRIMPYGNPGNDWVKLDERWIRRAEGKTRNKNIIGYVFLTRKNNGRIIETATRESLTDNYEFRYLRDEFILAVIKEFEEYRKAEKDAKEFEKPKMKYAAKASSEITHLADFIEGLDLKESHKTTAVSKLKEISGFVEKQDTDAQKKVEEVTSNLEMYRNLASLGISALAFHHEILQPVGRIIKRQTRLLKYWQEWKDDKKRDWIDKTASDVRTIIDLNTYIREFAALFKGIKGTKRKREEIDFKKSIAKFKEGFVDILADNGIGIEVVVTGGDIKDLYMNKASWESIVMNLLSNSIKALGNVQRQKKAIRVTFEKTPGHLKIQVHDNGYGIDDGDILRVFDPLWTTYREENTGTGMGMTIVREIVEDDYKGEIVIASSRYEKEYPGKGETTVQISIPLEELKVN